jgi:hypothetical protein
VIKVARLIITACALVRPVAAHAQYRAEYCQRRDYYYCTQCFTFIKTDASKKTGVYYDTSMCISKERSFASGTFTEKGDRMVLSPTKGIKIGPKGAGSCCALEEHEPRPREVVYTRDSFSRKRLVLRRYGINSLRTRRPFFGGVRTVYNMQDKDMPSRAGY